MTKQKRKTNKMVTAGFVLVLLSILLIGCYRILSYRLPCLTFEVAAFAMLPTGFVLSIIGFILSIKNKERGKVIAIFIIVISVAFFSSSEMRNLHLHSYLNEKTELKVVGVYEYSKSKDAKEIEYEIELRTGTVPTEMELASLRTAMNNYVSKKGGLFDQGWGVRAIVAETRFFSSKAPLVFDRFTCSR